MKVIHPRHWNSNKYQWGYAHGYNAQTPLDFAASIGGEYLDGWLRGSEYRCLLVFLLLTLED